MAFGLFRSDMGRTRPACRTTISMSPRARNPTEFIPWIKNSPFLYSCIILVLSVLIWHRAVNEKSSMCELSFPLNCQSVFDRNRRRGRGRGTGSIVLPCSSLPPPPPQHQPRLQGNRIVVKILLYHGVGEGGGCKTM